MIIVLENRRCIVMKKKRSIKTHGPEFGLKKLLIYFPKNIVLNGPI